jgi:hypothetical protein
LQKLEIFDLIISVIFKKSTKHTLNTLYQTIHHYTFHYDSLKIYKLIKSKTKTCDYFNRSSKDDLVTALRYRAFKIIQYLNIMPSDDYIDSLILHNNLEILKYLKSLGYQFKYKQQELAISLGNFEIVKYFTL